MLCSFHPASGVARATTEHERRSGAEAAYHGLGLLPLCTSMRSVLEQSNALSSTETHLMHEEGGGVRVGDIWGAVYGL